MNNEAKLKTTGNCQNYFDTNRFHRKKKIIDANL